MIKYKVAWYGSEDYASVSHWIWAQNETAAIEQAVEKFKYPSHKWVNVKTRGLFSSTLENPHYVEPQKALSETVDESHSQQPEVSDGSAEWRESLGAAAKNIRNQVSPPQSSVWAKAYRVCGFFFLVFGIIGTIGTAQENEAAGFQFAVIAIALTLTCFLAAFLIDVLTDMRHYLKRIAEKQ